MADRLLREPAPPQPRPPADPDPFDDRLLNETRAVLDRYGYELLDSPMLERMDKLGRKYWPGEDLRPHVMRKFCSWNTYDTFLCMDADIVVLRSLDPYFEAIDALGADFMHFATGMVQVYRPGPARTRADARRTRVLQLQRGAFMGRRGQLTPDGLDSLVNPRVEPFCAIACPARAGGRGGAIPPGRCLDGEGMSPRVVYQILRGVPYQLHSWLSARGLAEWRGSRA